MNCEYPFKYIFLKQKNHQELELIDTNDTSIDRVIIF